MKLYPTNSVANITKNSSITSVRWRVTTSQVYSKVVENPYESAAANPTKALTGSVNVYFPALRDWIKSHVEKHQVNSYISINNSWLIIILNSAPVCYWIQTDD